jgi:AraC-like DNA-binding protein
MEPVYPLFPTDPLYLRRYIPEITVVYLTAYFLLTFFFVVKAFRKENVSLFVRRYKNLTWLRNFNFSLVVIVILLVIVKATFGRDAGDYLIISCISFIIYGTSISVINTSAFFTEHLSTDLTAGKKYARSSLSEQDKAVILKKLKEGMENEKYYRNNLVSQTQLSRKLLIPTHHISQVINEKLNLSFFEFIAKYRINEAEQMLSDPKCNHMTIEDISEGVGYISKAAFNKTFKKITGKTPSEYRN